MDNIYQPRYKKTTQIEQKFNLYRRSLGSAASIPKDDEEIKRVMHFSGTDDEFNELNYSISLHTLSHVDDIRPTEFDPSVYQTKRRKVVEVPKRALSLNTVACLIEQQDRFIISHKNRYTKYNKYKHVKLNVDFSKSDIVPHSEELIYVRIYEPFRYKSYSLVTMKPKLSQRFLVLGSQLLTELRDRIHCQCNHGPFYDISENPLAPLPSITEKPFDHGFFFITDTFYNDTRQNTHDYSEVIRKWTASQKLIGELKADSMENTRFKDLTVRLGAPHLYQHHGNCEHLFTLSDVRLIAAGDSLNRSDYPILDMISSSKNIFCMLCGLTYADVIVVNSSRHIQDPSYLCNTCFHSYHYIDGKKIGEFQAYRYSGNRAMSTE